MEGSWRVIECDPDKDGVNKNETEDTGTEKTGTMENEKRLEWGRREQQGETKE